MSDLPLRSRQQIQIHIQAASRKRRQENGYGHMAIWIKKHTKGREGVETNKPTNKQINNRTNKQKQSNEETNQQTKKQTNEKIMQTNTLTLRVK